MNVKNSIDERPWLVLPFAFLLLFVPVILIEWQVVRASGGTFMYPLDDTFIHMTVAKTLALHGNWGIAAGEFESASSSVLYTLLLAGLFAVFSVHAWIPFAVNALAAAVLLVVLGKRLRKEGVRPAMQLIIFVALIVLTPLPILVISGMEHTLQCLFSFLFLFGFTDWLASLEDNNGETRKKFPIVLVVYGMLACSIRYEGAFMVGSACLLLLYKRRIGNAFLLGICGALPIAVFGIYSITKGSYFLPNSVLLKSDGARLSLGGVASFLFQAVEQKLTISLAGIATTATQHLLIILPLIYLLLAGPLKKAVRHSYALIILISCTFFQLTLASTGWFYRYEAYLILCSVYLLLLLLYQYRAEVRVRLRQYPLATAFLLFALFLPMLSRSAAAFAKASTACLNIYDQQYQMAKFLHAYYDDQVVAVNDIGAVSYFKKAKNLDLWGLADIDVARKKKDNQCSPEFLDSLSRSKRAGIAIVFDSWFSDSLLIKWNKVATWTIPNNVICQDSTVTFYAIDHGQREELKNHLEQFQPMLPFGVHVKYF